MTFRVEKKTLGTVVAMVFVLAGCGKDKESVSPSQVLARVNDAEITVHELNYILSRQQEKDNTTKQHDLDQLIDQEVMVQRAMSLKLDRDPNVLQAIEFSKRQILAQAAADREVGAGTEPGTAEVQDFYDKNPLLFSDRKIYAFTAFSIPGDALTPAVSKLLDESHSVQDTRAILTKAGLKYSDEDQKRGAEQLPTDQLSKFGSMKVGDILVFQQPGQNLLIQLTGSTPASISVQDATPMIKAYLQNAEKQKIAESKYKALKSAAKIEYIQRFDKAAAAAPAAVANKANASDVDSHLAEGIKGLH